MTMTSMVAFLICDHLRLGRRNSGRARGAKPQCRGARVRLRAETVGRRNRRHLRALPEDNRHQPTAPSRPEDRCRPSPLNPSAGRALTPGAVALMLMLCLSWGFNQIAVKLVLPDVPPMLQALIRSLGALPVMLFDRLAARRQILRARRHAGPGLFAGMLFGIEFVLIFAACSSPRRRARRCFSTPRRSSWRSAPISFSASG